MVWQQIYDPLGNMVISTGLAAVPVVVMLAALGFFHIKAHIAAGMGLAAALLVAIFVYGMPADMAGRAALLGGLTVCDPQDAAADLGARFLPLSRLDQAARHVAVELGKLIAIDSEVVIAGGRYRFHAAGERQKYR